MNPCSVPSLFFCASETAKKYVRLGATPRAGQALISAAKVKALMNGRYNVSYNDINELALPVLRHRIKLTFEAAAERITADDIVTMIVEEMMQKNNLAKAKTVDVTIDEVVEDANNNVEVTAEATETTENKKLKFFRRK